MNTAIGTLHSQRPQTWSHWLSTHRGWLGAVLYARLRDHHAVDEVLQETALAASKNGHLPDDEGITRWLYRVAIRQSLLYRRRKGRYERRLKMVAERQGSGAALETISENPFRLLVASERADLVQAALDELAPRECEMLLLKYTENWTCQEIAERLGTSTSAIKSRLLRARQKLRSILLHLDDNWNLP